MKRLGASTDRLDVVRLIHKGYTDTCIANLIGCSVGYVATIRASLLNPDTHVGKKHASLSM